MPDSGATDPLTVGFRNVDATAPQKILHCLDTLEHMESVRAYKAKAQEYLNLKPGSFALDVACGRGDEVANLKARCARAVGVDRSVLLLESARVRHQGLGCEFTQGEASDLPFADNSFDAVRIDRSLQHIEQPWRVILEMARVARPGGVVLCAEPDWGTFLLGGTHSVVTDRIQHHWISGFENPWIGRELAGYLAEAGIVEIQTEGFWLPTRGFDQSDILFEIAETALSVSHELPEAIPWLESYRKGEAYAGVLILVSWGRKPEKP